MKSAIPFLLCLVLIFSACQPQAVPTAQPPAAVLQQGSGDSSSTGAGPATSANSGGQPPAGESASGAGGASIPTATSVPVIYQRPPDPGTYCTGGSGQAGANADPPEGFLYQPFTGSFNANAWSCQMDHDRPDYTQNGVMASLGETMRFDVTQPGLSGGTQAFKDGAKRQFSRFVNYATVLKMGYALLAYQSPSFETFQYYDGHDGNDFAVSGPALASADGTVTFAGATTSTLGRVVEIFHPQGYLTTYAHLAGISEGLKSGDQVKAGDVIGTIGGSAYVQGGIKDNYWGIHLHFSVFHWNGSKWNVVDPFGWDPWAGPDAASRERKQLEDPLASCNDEVSYDLWVEGWPRPVNEPALNAYFNPNADRYVGGWLGADAPASSGMSGQIAYASNGEIHLMDLLTRTDVQLTSSGDNHSPDWSFDGMHLLYIHGQAEGASLVVLDDHWQQVASFPARAAKWANGSEQIYWLNPQHSTIYLSDLNGGNAQVYYDGVPDPSVENWENLVVGPNGGLDVSVRLNGGAWGGTFRRLQADEYQSSVDSFTTPDLYGAPTAGCLFSLAESRASGLWAWSVNTGCMAFAPGSIELFSSTSPNESLPTYGDEPAWSPNEDYLVYRFLDFATDFPGMDYQGLAVINLRSLAVERIVIDPNAQQPSWRP